MANRTEHLLVTLGEEGTEVAKEASKCIRFGLDDFPVADPVTGEANSIKSPRHRLGVEVSELEAMIDWLRDEGIVPPRDVLAYFGKRPRVEQYMEYARKIGALDG